MVARASRRTRGGGYRGKITLSGKINGVRV